jgi:hypothetical protein
MNYDEPTNDTTGVAGNSAGNSERGNAHGLPDMYATLTRGPRPEACAGDHTLTPTATHLRTV